MSIKPISPPKAQDSNSFQHAKELHSFSISAIYGGGRHFQPDDWEKEFKRKL